MQRTQGIEPEDHTAAFKIFHYYIDCRLPASFANERRNNYLGSPKYHDKHEKEVSASQMVFRQHTAAEMAEYYDRGALLIVDDPKDSIKMYEWITQYLRERRNQMTYLLTDKSLPTEDFNKLDAWAAELYKIARPYVTDDVTKTMGMRKMDRHFGNISRMPRRMPMSHERDHGDPLKDLPEDHISISDEISKLVAQRRSSS